MLIIHFEVNSRYYTAHDRQLDLHDTRIATRVLYEAVIFIDTSPEMYCIVVALRKREAPYIRLDASQTFGIH